jgi:hypothetical protein
MKSVADCAGMQIVLGLGLQFPGTTAMEIAKTLVATAQREVGASDSHTTSEAGWETAMNVTNIP